jgi:hypothetical protein
LKTLSKLALFVAMLALAATPAFAVGPPAQAKAYGKHCQGQSKKRSDAAPGTKGTPFSQCVVAMAKLATGRTDSPRQACKALSKRRSDAPEGMKGTPFSQCAAGGAKLLRQRMAQNDE